MAVYALNSLVLFHIARDAYERHSASDIIVTVVFAALGLEGFVNEMLERLKFPSASERAQAAAVVAEADRLYNRSVPTARKIHGLSDLLTGHKLDPQGEPFVDVELLIAVRNFLVHQRPEKIQTDSGETIPQDLVAQLVERGIVPPRPKHFSEGTFGVLCEGTVGRWAFNSTLKMVHTLGAMEPGAYLFAYRFLAPIP